MSDQKTQLNVRYFAWLLGTVLCTMVPVGLLIRFGNVPAIGAACVGFGFFAGGMSGAMTSAYKLGVKHGAASDAATAPTSE